MIHKKWFIPKHLGYLSLFVFILSCDRTEIKKSNNLAGLSCISQGGHTFNTASRPVLPEDSHPALPENTNLEGVNLLGDIQA